MSSWTLEYDGSEQTLEAWGIDEDSLVRSQRSQTVGTLSFTVSGDATAAQPFDYGETIIIRRNRTGTGPFAAGSIWWQGVVTKPGWSGSGTQESISVECSDPWYFLEDQNMVYEQVFKVFTGWVGGITGSTPILANDSTSHVTLNQDIDGGIWGTSAQLEDILDWAISQGAPLAYTAGTFPDMRVPLREERDITCAEAIRLQLAYMDAVTMFDFTVTPPKLVIQRRSALAAVNLAATLCDELKVNPRYDLQVDFVKLRFEKEYQDSGGTFAAAPVLDIWPDPLPAKKYGGLIGTIVLAPSQAVTAKQYLTCATLNPGTVGFWKDVKPEMDETLNADAADLFADLTILSYTIKDAGGGDITLPRYVAFGNIDTWMDVDYAPVTVTAEVSYTVKHKLASTDKVDVLKSRKQTISVQLVATNAVTGWYQSRTVLDPGEDPAEFAGLAHDIYSDLNTLNYDGSVQLTEEECAGAVTMGCKVNVTGGATAWATMASAVQAITENAGTGQTTIALGVNEHLTIGKLVDLLRVNRTRRFMRFSSRASGSYAGANDISLPATNAKNNTTEAPELFSEQSVSSETDGKLTRVQLKSSVADSAEVNMHSTTATGAVDSAKPRVAMKTSDMSGDREAKFQPFIDATGATHYVLATAPPSNGGFRGEYLDTATYRVGDIVIVASGANAGTYICVSDNPGSSHAPWAGGGYWVKFFSGNALGQWM